MNAIPIEEMDKTKHEVGYIHVVYPNGYRVWYHVEYVPYRSVEADGFCNPDCDVDWFDYDEENDKYWAPEGFYECPEDDETEHLILGDDTPITHWAKSLPDPRKESAAPAFKKLCALARELPEGLEADWKGTNHFELTRPGANYWWITAGDIASVVCRNYHKSAPSSAAVNRLGLLLDLAAAVSAALPALKEKESES